MAKGITHSCANTWRAIARAGGWHSLQRVAKDWDGIYAESEIRESLETLQRSGFLELGESRRHGGMYAYTAKCHQLPGETLLPVTASDGEPDAVTTVAAPARNDVMNTVYTPPQPIYRAGALDYQACPSLHMGKRRAFRSEA